MDRDTLMPAPGYALVQVVPPGETPGGIHIPDTAKVPTVVLVRASAGHYMDGAFVECSIPTSSELVLAPGTQTIEGVKLPADHAFVYLRNVVGYEPPHGMVQA